MQEDSVVREEYRAREVDDDSEEGEEEDGDEEEEDGDEEEDDGDEEEEDGNEDGNAEEVNDYENYDDNFL